MKPAGQGAGWWFILLLGLVYMFNFVDRTTVSVLGESIRRDLSLSDLQLGLLGGFSFAIFYAALGIPLARLAERRSRVRIIAGVTALWSVMTALSGVAGSFGQLLAARVGVAVGEAGLTPSLVSMLSDRFPPERRAAVFSAIALGAPIGAAAAAIVGGVVAAHYGWRTAYIGLALIWGAVGFPILFFFFRDARSKAAASQATVRPVLPGLTVRQSMLSWRYLALALAMLVFTFVSMSFVITIIPILTWQGIPKTAAAGLAAIVGASAVVGRLATGWLLDRFDPRLVTTLAMALPVATAMLLMGAPGSAPVAALAILIMGLSLGAEIDAVAFMVGHYFGLRHYGLLFGTLISASSAATSAAPLIAGSIYDSTGGYRPLLIAMIPMSLIAASLIAGLGRPGRWDASV